MKFFFFGIFGESYPLRNYIFHLSSNNIKPTLGKKAPFEYGKGIRTEFSISIKHFGAAAVFLVHKIFRLVTFIEHYDFKFLINANNFSYISKEESQISIVNRREIHQRKSNIQ